MRKPLFYALSVTLLPLLVGMDGCMSKTLNHCVASPEALGCPELCLDDPALEHCSELPDGILIDGGLCGQCTVNVPFCDEATLECVKCTAEVECECVGDADCPDEAPVCGADGQCGGCSVDLDCAGRERPVCDSVTGECNGCSQDSQCAHLADTPTCDEATGRCAECTVETEADDCPAPDGEDFGPACDPILLTCTGSLRNSLAPCLPCISDSECTQIPGVGARRCVGTTFLGSDYGTYCLIDIEDHRMVTADTAASCPLGMRSLVENGTSIGGVPSDYCTVNPAQTTCEGLYEYGLDCQTDGSCVSDGAVCSTGNASGYCTYVCSSPADCPGDMNGNPLPDSCPLATPRVCILP